MKKKRDYGIELLRIIACILVVFMHIKTGDISSDGGIIKEQTLLSCMGGYSVAIFFAITGCFWYNQNRPFKTVVGNHVRNVLIPPAIIVLLFMCIPGYIESGSFIPTKADFSVPDWSALYKGILSQTPSMWGHDSVFAVYWYVFDFTLLLVWFPIIRRLAKEKSSDKIFIGLIIIAFINRVFEEIQWFTEWDFGIREIPGVPIALVMTLIGYEVYKRKDTIRKHSKVCMLVSGAVYIITVIVSYYLQCALYRKDPSPYDGGFALWKQTPSFIITASLLVFFISINTEGINDLVGKIILACSGITFYVYLVHQAVAVKLMSVDIFWEVRQAILDKGPSHGKYFIAVFVTGFMIIAIAIPICIVMKGINRLVQRGIDACINKK